MSMSVFRHSDIICPAIPDPSALFKDMMMSGNKELKVYLRKKIRMSML